MFQLELKRAAVALAGGRLEEAYRLVRQPAVREHREGQRLVNELIDALLIRASGHIDFDRLPDARHDADLALALGGRKAEVAETLKQINALEQTGVQATIEASEPLAKQGLAELTSGRLDRAQWTDHQLTPIRLQSPTAIEFHNHLKRCQIVIEHLHSGHYDQALRELTLLEQTVPAADWISAAKSSLEAMIESNNSLLSGPLGLLASPNRSTHPSTGQPVVKSQPLPQQLLLQVDGVGGLLLHRDARLTIGSAASSSRFDLPIQTADLNQPLTILRDGDDYFAESPTAFLVNDKRTQKRLLISGDQIAIGSRGRIRFYKPLPASASAVLQLAGAGLARRDVRNVVMLADSLIFASSGGHFNLPLESSTASSAVVIYCQGEGLAVRLRSQTAGEPASQPLHVGGSIVVGQTRFALANFSSR